jgi:hypothetical protein
MAYESIRAFLNAFAVTPSDSVIVSAFGFYVGTAGDLAVMPAGQESNPARGGSATPVVFTNLPVGFVIRDFAISRFMATNTTPDMEIIAFGPT